MPSDISGYILKEDYVTGWDYAEPAANYPKEDIAEMNSSDITKKGTAILEIG